MPEIENPEGRQNGVDVTTNLCIQKKQERPESFLLFNYSKIKGVQISESDGMPEIENPEVRQNGVDVTTDFCIQKAGATGIAPAF